MWLKLLLMLLDKNPSSSGASSTGSASVRGVLLKLGRSWEGSKGFFERMSRFFKAPRRCLALETACRRCLKSSLGAGDGLFSCPKHFYTLWTPFIAKERRSLAARRLLSAKQSRAGDAWSVWSMKKAALWTPGRLGALGDGIR